MSRAQRGRQMYLVSDPNPCLRAALILSQCRCCPGIHIPAKKMAERSLLCRGLFARAFQADMAYGSFHCTESFVAYRVRLPVRQLGFHLLFPRKSQISLLYRGMEIDSPRPTST